jgi:hypothetical protein
MAGYTSELKKILTAAACRFERQGKGDHEIWYSPKSGKRFPIDGNIRSRHTANEVLKQAGLPKAFLGCRFESFA